ncbi:MAG: hypothetical protein HC902_03800 [Calothrix sp. SM1_5_4]|nr:hypothetical protein [Calothrix sp. SM1_5_4]
MIDFMFFVKTFFLTVAVVLLMQIQVGDRTIETHAIGWIQNSALVSPLNTAAQGGAKMFKDLIARISGGVEKNVAKNKKEEKSSSSSFRWGSGHPPPRSKQRRRS